MPTQKNSGGGGISRGGPWLGEQRQALPVEVAILRPVSEQGTMSVGQVARLLGEDEGLVWERVVALREAGWVTVERFAGWEEDWVWLRRGGAVRAGTGFEGVLPSAAQVPHRKGINEVRLMLEAEGVGGKWVCERELWRGRDVAGYVPDGLWIVGGRRIAIEVELARKVPATLRDVVEGRLRDFDEVRYFCGKRSFGYLRDLKNELGDEGLVVREVPAECEVARRVRCKGRQLVPTAEEVGVLWVISEEGIVAASALGPMLGMSAEAGLRKARELEVRNLVRREHEVRGDGGWIRCTPRSNELSGTGLGFYRLDGVGGLEQRLALQRIRCELVRTQRGAKWVGRRWLVKGRKDPRSSGIPSAVVVVDGREVAVMVMSRRSERHHTIRRVEQWLTEFDEVWCYGDPVVCRRIRRWKDGCRWRRVEVREAPSPAPVTRRARD